MKKLKLATKITTIVGICVSLILAVTFSCFTFIQNKTEVQNAYSDSNQIAKETSATVKSDLETALHSARSLAQAMSAYESVPLENRRQIYNVLIKETALENSNIIGAWACFEPNALDGLDSRYANAQGYDQTGRFIPNWSRGDSGVEYSALKDYEKQGAGDYYLLAKSSGKETVLEPYLYEMSGKSALLTTFSVPIHNSLGKVVGVAGVDLSLDTLNKTKYGSSVYKTQNIYLVSNSGNYIIHSNKNNLGLKLTDVESNKDSAKKALEAIKEGKQYNYDAVSEINEKPCNKTLVPLALGSTATPWSVGVSIETSEIMAQTKASLIVLICIFVLIIITVIIAIGLSVKILIKKPLSELVAAADQQANGNFNLELKSDRGDELGMLYKALAKANENMNKSLSMVKVAASQVSIGADQISDSSIQLSQGASEQASSIEELTASIEELSSQTVHNAENAKQANEKAGKAKSLADSGSKQMSQLLDAMESIARSSDNISKIIKVIDEIAFQTNILALNAAVEAARAGQHGKGFAVVAEEVRNLAARSAVAAKDTTALIEDSVKNAGAGGVIANETSKALSAIAEEIEKVAGLVYDIMNSSNEQSVGINQINQGIIQVSQVVQANAAASEENAAASEKLSGQSQALLDQVSHFKLKEEN